jgi:hypothetical protein
MSELNDRCLLGEHVNSLRCKNCGSCGWNPKAAAARNAEIAANGLTEGPDGVRRLIIRKGAETNGGNE